MEFPMLEPLDEPARRSLVAAARVRRFRRDEVIFHEGDPADSLHLLRRGHVGIRASTPTGNQAILAVLGPGATFGELALLADSARRSGSATALDGVETLVLTRDQFGRLRRTVPAIDRFLVDLLLSYVRRLDARLLEALYVPVEQRVLRRLLALGEAYGDGATAVVPLTQETVAELAGTTRPTANQVLRSLETAGLIRLHRRQVHITDLARLRDRVAGSGPPAPAGPTAQRPRAPTPRTTR